MPETQEIAGFPLQELELPIFRSLEWFSSSSYSFRSGTQVVFDGAREAAKLELVDNGRYSAWSEVPVIHIDGPKSVEVGMLQIVAFAPGDGTGSETTYSLDDIDTGNYPRTARVVPKDKPAVGAEIHLSLVSQRVGEKYREPILLSGNLDVLGFKPDKPKRLTKILEVGDDERDFRLSYGGKFPASFVTGFYNCLGTPAATGERFGETTAVYNPWKDRIQVAGFLALSHKMAVEHFSIFKALQVQRNR